MWETRCDIYYVRQGYVNWDSVCGHAGRLGHTERLDYNELLGHNDILGHN